MPLPNKRPSGAPPPTRESVFAPTDAPVHESTSPPVHKPTDKEKTYSVRGVDPALTRAIKHLAVDLEMTMGEMQETMMRDMLRKHGKEAPNG